MTSVICLCILVFFVHCRNCSLDLRRRTLKFAEKMHVMPKMCQYAKFSIHDSGTKARPNKNINICLVVDCLPLPLLNRDLDRSRFANGNKSGYFTPTLFVSQKDISKDILQWFFWLIQHFHANIIMFNTILNIYITKIICCIKICI